MNIEQAEAHCDSQRKVVQDATDQFYILTSKLHGISHDDRHQIEALFRTVRTKTVTLTKAALYVQLLRQEPAEFRQKLEESVRRMDSDGW